MQFDAEERRANAIPGHINKKIGVHTVQCIAEVNTGTALTMKNDRAQED